MISKKLEAATSFDPTKQSQSMAISSLNNLIEKDAISLPIYQRDLSWSLAKAVALFNYQLYGRAPVAPLSLNKLSLDDSSTVPQVRLLTRKMIDANDLKEGHLSIIDGQQRLTTNYKAYIDDPSFSNIVLDISRGKFRLIRTAPNNNQIPVGKLLNREQSLLMNYIHNTMNMSDFSEVATLIAARGKLLQYSYTLHIANSMDEKEQIQWFEVLNNAGSKVSALQMTFAKLGSIDFDIYAEYGDPFKQLISDFDLNDLFSPYTTNVSYPVALLNPELEILLGSTHKINYAPIPSDTKEGQLIKLEISDLKGVTQRTLKSLDLALKFFEENGLVNKVNRMDYILYISGFISFNGTADDYKDKLIQWVNEVDFSNKSNRERRKLFSDLINL
ncbi:GmrSD restriction endonuclease domain-containing protein [Enterococcus dongliensis]|uniref:GmrSD restriction endonuclease domain-containing protein n=1 Tax=Enterococcus dongliensis TaxID=2559925 RepID=UPI00288FF17E|nr:DUF262 domain-containing protein [Enterococcus dongliensis]MDT2604651.1 DUF262 domain-containing protein [Enterococcus dongliensis]MDT2645896.1 DUF262 domain-containing protein [Enterococcus dongliensis]MDT2712191.1 DUF262 domain-containing protein [Enterococcus dongliensis]